MTASPKTIQTNTQFFPAPSHILPIAPTTPATYTAPKTPTAPAPINIPLTNSAITSIKISYAPQPLPELQPIQDKIQKIFQKQLAERIIQIREQYIHAKAKRDAISQRMAILECEYIKKNKIKNSDGSIPRRIWCIKDTDVFNYVNKKYSEEMNAIGLCDEFLAAQEKFLKAEDALVEINFELVPFPTFPIEYKGKSLECKEELKKALDKERHDWNFYQYSKLRFELIKIVLDLDVSELLNLDVGEGVNNGVEHEREIVIAV